MNRTYLKNYNFKEKIKNTIIEKDSDYSFYKENDVNDNIFYESILNHNHQWVSNISKDLKIEFDFENVIVKAQYISLLCKTGESILSGYNIINDFQFLGIYAGGDWERPVFLILYFDENKRLRAYIPSSGNVYDKKEKVAFEEDEVFNLKYDEDLMKKSIIKRFGLNCEKQ